MKPAGARSGSAASPPRGRIALAAALVVAIALAPTLARTPQSGDGAEVVRTAVQGGVLHPPGFPLQAWLDRGLARLPVEPTLAISALGLAAHAATAGLIVAILFELGAGLTGALAGAAAFALFPAVWSLAVEPEVFAPAIVAVAFALWLAVRRRGAAPGVAAALVAGLAAGLGAATHPIVLAALPALAVAAFRALAPGGRRGARFAVFAAAAAVPPLALYGSLPLLRTASPWPDWGALVTPADVLRHVLRVEYGAWSFSAAPGERMVNGFAIWISEAARVWNVALLVALAGLASLGRRADRASRLAVIGTFAFAAAILALGRLPEQSYSVAYLEKLQGPMVLAAALLLGLGVDAIRRARGRAIARGLDAAVAAAAVAWLVTGWPAADAAADRTLALHQQAVAEALGDSTVYVTEGDLESFMGVEDHGTRRYPVLGPDLSLEWYWREVAPRLEPRVMQGGALPASWPDYVRTCFARGLAVAGTSYALVASGGVRPRLEGLVYVARPGAPGATDRVTVAGARRLGPIAARLPSLPPGRRELSRFYARRFARAFAGAAEALQAAGDGRAAAAAHAVEASILRGDPPAARSPLLDAFEAACRAAGY